MEEIEIRNVREDEDGVLQSLALACGGTLDVHTPYTYWVLTHYFAEYCFVAVEREEAHAGGPALQESLAAAGQREAHAGDPVSLAASSDIAEGQGKAVGFLTAVVNDKKALIWQAGVLPEYAERKIGRGLLDHLMQTLRERGVSCAETTIAGSNAASRALLLHYCERSGIPVKACGMAGPKSDAHDAEILYRLTLG